MAETKEILFKLTASATDIQKELTAVTNQLNAQRDLLKSLAISYRDAQKVVANYAQEQQKIKQAINDNQKEQAQLEKQLRDNIITQEQYNTSISNSREEQKRLERSLEQLNSTYRQANVTIENYAEKQLKLKSEIQELGRAQRGYIKDLQNINKLTNAAEGSNEELAVSIALLTKEYNQLSKAERETGKRGQELTKVLGNQRQSLIDNNKAVNDSRLNVGNYESAFEGLDAVIGSNITSLIGPGALVAGVGLAADALRQAGQAVLDIEKKFTKLRGEVQNLTGETGPALDSLVIRIESISQTFDKDFNETLIATNSLAKQLSISQEEAATIIEKGFLAGADQSGQFLDILSEYPAQLQSIGLSADEAVTLITQQVQQGIFSDKGVDTLKEAGLRLRELPKATKDALDGIGLSSVEIEEALKTGQKSIFEVIQEVSKRLDELPPQSAEVGTAIADIFGGAGEDAGLKFITTLKDARGNIDSLIDPTNALTQLQIQQLEVNERLAGAQNELSKVFEGTGGEIDNLIKEGKIFLIEVLLEIINESKRVLASLEPVIKVVKAVGGAFGSVIDVINNTLQRLGLVSEEFSLLGTVAKAIAKGITNVMFGPVKIIGQIIDRIKQLIGLVTDGVDRIKQLSNEFLGTEFDVKPKVDTSQAENDLKSFEDMLKIPPVPVEVDLDTQKARAEAAKLGDALTKEEIKAAEKATQELERVSRERNEKLKVLNQKRISDEIAQVQLQLTYVESGSKKELELRQKLLDRQLELSLISQEKGANEELLLKRQTEIKKNELTSNFVNERLEISVMGLESAQKFLESDLEKEIQLNLEANTRISQDGELTTEKLIQSKNLLLTREKEINDQRVLNEQFVSTQTQEFSSQTLFRQIEDLNKLLEEERLTAEQRKVLEEQLQQTRLQLAGNTLNAIGQLNQTIGDIQQARKEKELAAAQGNAEKEEEINRKFAQKEKATAIRQSIIQGALAVVQALPNIPLSLFVGGLAAAQTAIIAAQQFAKGGLTTDKGEIADLVYAFAFGGFTFEGKPVQMIDSFQGGGDIKKPTLGLIGERGPEFVASNKTLKKKEFAPALKAMDVFQKTNRVIPFANGGFTPGFTDGGFSLQQANNSFNTQEFAKVITGAIAGLDLSVAVSEIKKVQDRVKVKETQSSLG